MPAYSPVDDGGFSLGEPVVDGQPAQQNDPQAVFQPVHDVIDSLLEMRKREILCPDRRHVLDVFLGDMRERPLEISEVVFGETGDPAAGAGDFVASPYIRARYRLGENLGHRRHSFAAHAVPAAHCMAGH